MYILIFIYITNTFLERYSSLNLILYLFIVIFNERLNTINRYYQYWLY